MRGQVTPSHPADPGSARACDCLTWSRMATTTSSVAQSDGAGSRATGLTALLDGFPALVTLALAAQLVVLSPVVNTGFWNDDDANAYTTGYIRWVGDHFWQFIWSANSTQIKALGRPMPLGVLQTYGIFYVLHDRVIYKLVLIALTLIASVMLAIVVRRLGGSAALAALSAALPAVVWQLHLQHDPLISYVGLVQTVTIYAAAMVLVFQTWLRRGGRWRIVLVILLIAAADVTYQDAYLLPLLLIPVAWHDRCCTWRRAVRLASPGLAVGGGFIFLALILERNLPASSGYTANYDPSVVLTAWAKILTSGLPIISWADTPGARDLPPSQVGHAALRGVAVAVLLFPLLWATARSAATTWFGSRRTVVAILVVTGLLMVTPAALTAIAPQYQEQLVWGWGYLPMFFAATGWAILAALLIGTILRRLAGRRWMTLAASAAIATAGGITAGIDAEASARVVAYMQPAIASRNLVQSSFQHGVLDEVPTASSVLWYAPEMGLPTSIWVGGAINLEAWTREFVNRQLTMRLISPRSPSALVCSDATGAPAPCVLLVTPTFWLRTTSSGLLGFVAVAEDGTRRWASTTNTITALSRNGSRPLVYVEDPQIGAHGDTLPFTVTLQRPTSGSRPASVAIAANRLQVLQRGSGWALVQLAPQQPFVASSVAVVFNQ